MAAIASFIQLPKAALDDLRVAAVPKKRLFGRPRDLYHEFLDKRGRAVTEYRWSGFVLATLLTYLDEKQQVRLMDSEYDELGKFLTNTRGATHFIFTEAQKRAFLSKLEESFSEAELRDYYNGFNETHEAEAGKPMLDGIKALRDSLAAVDEDSVIVFAIG